MSDPPPPVHPGATAGGDGPLTPDRIDAILADFRAWLEAGGTPAPEPVGLLSVAREFTALRHEVNLQTRATRAAVEKLSEPPPSPDPREAQRPLVEGLADIADVLKSAHQRLSDAANSLHLWQPDDPPEPAPAGRLGRLGRLFGRGAADMAIRNWAETTVTRAATARLVLGDTLAGVADGYALSLKRVERALTAAGLEPIQTVGERFDPTTMEAVELADGDGQPSGTVLSESRRGYRWRGEVFRFARVTVAR